MLQLCPVGYAVYAQSCSKLLPAGHNACLCCISEARRIKPECPLCRAALPASHRFVVNHELRDLITLANALSSVQAHEDWQQVVASPVRPITCNGPQRV